MEIKSCKRDISVHEMRVAREIISFSQQEMQSRNFNVLKEIGVKVGKLSCIDPESLRFAFDMLKKETELSGTELKIETVSIEAVCRSCGREFIIDEFVFICPGCGSYEVEVRKGEELIITHLTFE
ncbi:MAG TPA: hydrogenase maturation nickel metallochaperone HypA [candidate division Zixibacteria bacterium]|nr:hydrogenase maturation nickel metallochaperone HypA [candidate division Zixibacteria bacterium]